ncbi:hypothetical protein F7725_009393 [Dissostichus mawsoni]|uniref:Uncharacterized protein n=1 Tax=Dissostichus mawsoni TaxID=36200 RepID=A0A7J5XKK7_DISMA|nr:hypothetical protein F7725_009393 [Dissostichus mawsoni]
MEVANMPWLRSSLPEWLRVFLRSPECQSPLDPFLGSRLAFGGPRSLQKTSKRRKVRRPARAPVPVHAAMVPCSSAAHTAMVPCSSTIPHSHGFRVPVPCPAAMVPAPEPAHTAMVPAPVPCPAAMVPTPVPAPAAMVPAPAPAPPAMDPAPVPAHTAMVPASVPVPAAMVPAPVPAHTAMVPAPVPAHTAMVPAPSLLKSPLESPLKSSLKPLLKSLLEFPLKFPLESPLKSPLKFPLESPLEFPLKVPLKFPLESPLKSPLKFPLESSLEFPLKCPLESPLESPLKPLLKSLLEFPLKFPLEVPLESPLKSPLKFPLESPLEFPLKVPLKFPLESPLKSPLKFPLESSLEFPLKCRLESPLESPLKPSLESLSKSLLKSPLKSPLKSSLKPLLKSLLEFPLKFPLEFPLKSPLKFPLEIIATSAGKEKQQEVSAAVRDNGQTPADFSSFYSKDLLPAAGGEEMTRGFLQELVHILLTYISKSSQRSSKVLDFHHPHQLREGLDGFSLELPDQPENLEQILVDCRDTLKSSPFLQPAVFRSGCDWCSRRVVNLGSQHQHDSCSLNNPWATSGFIDLANLSRAIERHVFSGMSNTIQNDIIESIARSIQDETDKEIHISPFIAVQVDDTSNISNKCQLTVIIRYVNEKGRVSCFILMEEFLLKKMQSLVGWSADVGDGIFCPGGTISNLYSILVARYHFYPEVKTRGMGALPRLALFTSEHKMRTYLESYLNLGFMEGTDKTAQSV